MNKLNKKSKIELVKIIWDEMDRTAAGMFLFICLFAGASWVAGKICLKANLHILAYFLGGAIIIVFLIAIVAFICSIINFANNVKDKMK